METPRRKRFFHPTQAQVFSLLLVASALLVAPARAQVSVTYTPTFTASGLSMWGTGVTSGGGSTFYGYEWNDVDFSIGGIEETAVGDFGARVYGSTSGKIGLDVALTTTQGHVDINLPYSVTISSATNLSNAGTHTLNIAHSLTSPGPNGFVKTTFAGVDLDVGVRVQAEATLGGEIAFFDRTGGSAKVLDLDISAPLFSYNGTTIGLFGRDFDITTGLSLPLPPPLTVDGLPKLTSLGSLTVSPPQMNANSGTGLTAHAEDVNMVSIDADLVGIAMALLGMPFNLLDPSVNVGGVGFTGTLLNTTVGLDLGLDQDISVTPTLGVILRSSTPLTYNTPGGPVTTSALVVTDLSLPISFTKGAGDVAIFPEFFLTTTLRNDLDLTLSGAFALEAIHYGFNIPGLISGSVGPLVDIDVNSPSLDIGLYDSSYQITGTSLNISQLGRSLTNVAPTVGNIGSNQAVNIPGLVGNFATSTVGGSLRLSNGSLYLNNQQLTIAAGGAIVLTSGSGATANRLSTPSLSNLGTLEVGTGSLVELTGANGLLNLNGSGVLAGGNFRVFGTLTYHGPSLTSNQGTLNVSGSLLNTSGGVQGNALRTLTSNSGTLTLSTALATGLGFTNTGTMTVNADVSTATMNNSGTLIVDSGGLTLSSANGFLNVNSSGVLSGGTYYLKGPIRYRGAVDETFPVLPGDTPFYLSGTAIVTNNANLTLAGNNGPFISHSQNDGALDGDALRTLSTNNGILILNTGARQTLGGGLINNGTLGIFDSGSILTVGGNFHNSSDKTLTISGGKLDLERASGDGNFTNSGTLNLLNNGTLEVDGSLGNFTNVDLGNRTGTLSGGTWNISGQVTYGTGTTTVPNIHRIGSGTTLNLVGGSFYNQFFNENALNYLTQNAGILNLNGVTVRSHYGLTNSGTILVTMPSGILGFRDSLSNTGTISIGAGSKLSTLGSATWADSANWANIDTNGGLFGIGNLILAGTMEYKGPAITQIAANNFLTLSGDSWRFRRLTASSTEVDGFALNTLFGGLNLTNRAKWEMPVGGSLHVASTGMLATSPTSVLVVQAGQLLPQYNANFTNNGTILLKHISTTPATLTAAGDFALAGTGSLQMTNHANNGIFGNVTVFNEATHTIAGAGQIRSGLYNRGAIESIGSAGLVINTANGTTITNSGVIRAGGSYTYPLVNGVPDHSSPTFVPSHLSIFNQAIVNSEGSTQGLISSGGSMTITTSTVTGGRVEVRPGSLLRLDDTTLSGVTFDAQPLSLTEVWGGVTKLSGTIGTTAGSRLTLLDTGNASDPAILEILSGQTFNHYGDALFQINSRIQGAGAFVNHGLARMHSAGSPAILAATFQNASDGILDIDHGGAVRWSGSVSNAGLVQVGKSANASAIGSLSIPVNTTLSGAGTIQIGGIKETVTGGVSSYAYIGSGRITSPDGTTPTLTNSNNTISGAGTVGDTRLSIVNESGGSIVASGAGATLLVNGPSLSNAGLLKAETDATLQVSSSFTNLASGTLTGGRYHAAGTIALPGAITTNAADLTLVGPGQLLDSSTGNSALAGLTTNASGAVLRLQGGAIQNTSVSLANAGSVVVGGSGAAAGGNLTVGSLTGGGTVNLADSGAVLRFDTTGGTSTGANAVSGAGQLHKLGGGTLTLSATNSYTGGTSLAVGTLVAAADNALGTGTLTMTGGTLRGDGTARTLANAISLRGNATIGGSSNLTINGILTPDANSRTLTVSNTGTTILGGVVVDPNSVFASLTVNVAGNLFINSIGSGTAGMGDLFKLGNGTLTIAGANSGSATIANGGTIVLAHNSALGAGPLVLNGATARTDGTARSFSNGLNLSGDATLAGTANLSFGDVLSLGGSSNRTLTVTNTGVTTLGGVSLTGNAVARNLTLDNTGAVTINGAIVNGPVGSNALLKTGTGLLTLAGASTFTGGLTINNGTVALGASDRLSDTGAVTLNAGTLQLSAPGGPLYETIGAFTMAGGTLGGDGTSMLTASSFDLRAGTVRISLGGSGGLTKTTGGTVEIRSIGTASNYTGGVSITGGVLTVHDDVAFGHASNAITIDGATLKTAAAFTSARPITIGSNHGTIEGVLTHTGLLAGTGALTKTGAGELSLAAGNTYQGGTFLNGGSIRVAADSSLGASGSGLTINGGTLAWSLNTTDASSNRPITITSAGGSLLIGGATLTLGGALTADGAFTKGATGTVVLSNNSALNGNVNITAGSLRLGASGQVADTSLVTVTGTTATGGILDLAGHAETIGGLDGNGRVALGAGTLSTGAANGATTFSGVVSGTGAVAKVGTGTLTLSGANTHSGGVIVTDGTLKAAHASSLGTGALRLEGGTFAVDTASLTLSNAVTLAGNATLAGSQSYNISGTTTVAADATLDVATTNFAVIRLRDVALAGGVTPHSLTLDIDSNLFVDGVISDGNLGGSLIKTGAGTLALFSSNTFTGGTLLEQGEIALAANDALGTGSLGISGGSLSTNAGARTLANDLLVDATLAVTGNGSLAVSGATHLSDHRTIDVAGTTFLNLTGAVGDATGSYGLTKTGTGTLALSTANSYEGGTTISAGTLSLRAQGAAGSGLVVVNSGANLAIDENLTLAGLGGTGTVTIAAGKTFDFATAGAATFDGTTAGTGLLRKIGGGTLVLTQGTSRSGHTSLAGGILQFNHFGAFGSGTIIFDGGGLSTGLTNPGISNPVLLAGSARIAGPTLIAFTGTVTLPGTRVMTIDPGSQLMVPGVIGQTGGTHGLVKQGAGTLGLFGANTYGGLTQVDAGLLVLGRTSGSALTGGLAVSAPGTARIDTVNQVPDAANISVSGSLQLNALEGIGTGGLSLQGGSISGPGALQFANNIGLSTVGSATTASISAPVSLVAGNHIFNVADGAAATDLTIGGSISQSGGTASLTKQGAGVLVLSNANSHGGGTFVEGGTLAVGHAGALGTGMLVVQSGTFRPDVDLNFGNIVHVVGPATFNTNGRTLLFTGLVTNSGALIKAGTGMLVLASANNHTGGTTLQAGTLAVDHNGGLGTGTLTIQGGALQSGTAGRTLANALSLQGNSDINSTPGLTFSGATTLTGSRTITVGPGSAATFTGAIGQSAGGFGLTKAGSGTLALSATNTYTGTTTVSGGTLVLNPGSAIRALTIGSGALVRVLGTNPVDNFSVVTINGGTYQIENGATEHQQAGLNMTGGQITTTGNGVLILDSLLTTNSTNTTASATGVRLAPNAGFLVNAGPSPGGIDFAVSGGISEAFAGMDLLKGGSGLMRLGGVSTYTGGTNVIQGHLALANANALPDVGTVTLNGGTTLRLNNFSDAIGGLTGTGQVQLGSVGAIDIGGGNATTSFGGSFTGNGTVRKVGSGTLTLSGTSNFSGSSAVNAGTLRLTNATGSALGTSNLTVAAGAFLTGDGAFTGSLSLGGTIAPGNSPGLLETGATTFLGGGTYLWELNDAAGTAGGTSGWDLLGITGTLTIAATSANPFSIDLVSLTTGNVAGLAANFDATQSRTFLIASASGGITGFDASDFSLDLSGFANGLLGGSWAIAQSGNNLNLVFSAAAIPEPSTYAMLLGVIALALAAWRRRASRLG